MVWVYRLSTYSNHLHFGYAENANSYGDVMKNGYFIPRSNVIYESAVFLIGRFKLRMSQIKYSFDHCTNLQNIVVLTTNQRKFDSSWSSEFEIKSYPKNFSLIKII